MDSIPNKTPVLSNSGPRRWNISSFFSAFGRCCCPSGLTKTLSDSYRMVCSILAKKREKRRACVLSEGVNRFSKQCYKRWRRFFETGMLTLSAPENAAAYFCSLQLTRVHLRSCLSTKAVGRHTVEALGLSKFGGWECVRGKVRDGQLLFNRPSLPRCFEARR